MFCVCQVYINSTTLYHFSSDIHLPMDYTSSSKQKRLSRIMNETALFPDMESEYFDAPQLQITPRMTSTATMQLTSTSAAMSIAPSRPPSWGAAVCAASSTRPLRLSARETGL